MIEQSTPIRYVQTVIHAIYDVHNIRVLCLRDPDGWELPAASPGAHIDLYLNNGLTRSYSLCGDSSLNIEYTLAVKRQNNGRGGSRYIHDVLRAGDNLRISLPRNTFPPIKPGLSYIFIAGGIGVTPFIPMLLQLEHMRAPYQMHLFYRNEPPLRDMLVKLGNSGDLVLHDRANSHNTTIADLLCEPDDDTHAFFCGPLAMLQDFTTATTNWAPGNVHKEFFAPPEIPVSGNAYTLTLRRSERRIDVRAGETALNALQRAGVSVASSCEGGICRACMVRWLDGEPKHQDLCLTDQERTEYFTPCVSGCAGAGLVIDL
ncbi:2Fe-2S iron-sulfur cluster binding domain-containing protein [Pusillimonas sp. TS35]|nr:2Fe-2S iron-sulfur cluster binding domain-containing protein [Pusillimonas sp. TS35]